MQAFGDYIEAITVGASQTYRYVDNNFVNTELAERKEKFRDKRVYEEIVEDRINPVSEDRPRTISGAKVREFKRTTDISEAIQMSQELIRDAFTKSQGDPEKLQQELLKIKINNYQTFPNINSQPKAFFRYLQFLKETQGDAAANERLKDYMHVNALNKAKAEMIP